LTALESEFSLLGNVRIQITLKNGDIIDGGGAGAHGVDGAALAAGLNQLCTLLLLEGT
jgi:hypothetical protein